MKLILAVCSTSSNHDFTNFYSYSGLFDGYEILDTGLLTEERCVIEDALRSVNFHQYQFDGDFSKMRNTLLDIVVDKYGECVVCMPDESWSISDFNRSEIVDSDVYITKIEDEDSSYYCGKIFKSHLRFAGSVRERLVGVRKSKFIEAKFNDTCLDRGRSWAADREPEDLFYKAAWLKERGDLISSINHYYNIANRVDEPPERRFLALVQLSALERNPNLLVKAAEVFPNRAKEAYYLLWRVSGDERWREACVNTSWGPYTHTMPRRLLMAIDEV